MPTSTAVAAIFGQRTRLRAYRRYTQVFREADADFDVAKPRTLRPERFDDEWAAWRPGFVSAVTRKGATEVVRSYDTAHDWVRPVSVEDCWVYVFVLAESTGTVAFLLECYVDEGGTVHVNPNRDRAHKNDWKKPGPGSSADAVGRIHELPRAVLGRARHYWFVGAPFRLTARALERLEADGALARMAAPADLRPRAPRDGEDEAIDVHVLLPLFVARQLHADLEAARAEQILFAGGDAGTARASRGQRDRAKQYFLSKALQGLLRDPDMAAKVEDDFRGDGAGRRELEGFIRRRELELARLAAESEAVAADLCRWMDRALFRAVVEGCEPADEAILLRHYAQCVAALAETPIGIAHLGRLLRRVEGDPAHFLTRHVLAPDAGDADAIANAAKAARSVVSLLQVVALARLASHQHQVWSVLDNLLNAAGTLTSVPAAWERKKGLLETFAVMKALAPDAEPKPGRYWVEAEVLAAKGPAVEGLVEWVGSADTVMRFVDCVNAALAVRAYLDTPQVRQELKARRLGGAVADVGLAAAGVLEKAFDLAGREAVAMAPRVAVRTLGVLSGVIAVAVMYVDAAEALERGDYDAAIAEVCSLAMTFLALPCAALAGLEAAQFLGPVAWVLTALAAASYMVYVWLKDEAIETFVAHCQYGRDLGHGDVRPSWSPARLADWDGRWDDQIGALHALTTAFAVGFGAPVWYTPPGSEVRQVSPHHCARIYVGAVDERTLFRLTWSWKASRGSGTQVHEWAALRGKHDPPSRRAFGAALRTDAHRRLHFDVEVPPAALAATNYTEPFASLTLGVRKDVRLPDGTTARLPFEGPLDFVLYEDVSLASTGRVVWSYED